MPNISTFHHVSEASVSMTVDEKFAAWVASKRLMLLSVAKQADLLVFRARKNGEEITDFHRAQEEYARRLKAAAEALGPPTMDPEAPPDSWTTAVPPATEGHVFCTSCKVLITDVDVAKRRHVGSKAHRDAMALSS